MGGQGSTLAIAWGLGLVVLCACALVVGMRRSHEVFEGTMGNKLGHRFECRMLGLCVWRLDRR
jgi:hypothetical protein